MRIDGNPYPAGIGGVGIEVPTEAPASSPALVAAREQRRIATIEAAEAATTAPNRKQAGRSAGAELFWTLPAIPAPSAPAAVSAAPPTSPAKTEAAVPSSARDSGPQEMLVENEQVTALQAQVSEHAIALSEQTIRLSQTQAELADARAELQACTAHAESSATTTRQLRTELAMAGQRITTLLARVSEQATALADANSELAKTHARLTEARAGMQAAIARAETADAALVAVGQRVQAALIGDVATAPLRFALPDGEQPESDPCEPLVVCEGGCGVPVDPDYARRTGHRWHGGLCADLAAAAAESLGRRAVA